MPKIPVTEKIIITANVKRRKANGLRRGLILPDDERLILARRRPSGDYWDFFDLATRLRAVDSASDFTNGFVDIDDDTTPVITETKTLEYVEVELDAPAEFSDILQGAGVPATGELDAYYMASNHCQIEAETPSLLLEWDAKLIANGDPFGYSSYDEEDARQIPHCMPIWYGKDTQPDDLETYIQSTEYQPDAFDVEIYKTETSYHFPNSKVREIVADIAHWWRDNVLNTALTASLWAAMNKVANTIWDAPADERKEYENWNPLNLSQNGTDISKRGRMVVRNNSASGSGYQVRLNSRLIYEPFDTGDTVNYKVTSEPSYSADAVPFSIGAKTPAKFYLKPQYLGFFRDGDWRHSQTLSLETYRQFLFSEDGWTNMQGSTWEFSTSFTGSGSAIPELFLGWSQTGFGSPEYDPDGPVYNFDSFSFDATTGAWSVSVTQVGGSGTTSFAGSSVLRPAAGSGSLGITAWWYSGGSGSVGNPPPLPSSLIAQTFGNAKFWFKFPEYNAGATYPRTSYDGDFIDYLSAEQIDPNWAPLNTSVQTYAEIFRGAHVGRFPVFPRSIRTNNVWASPLLYRQSNVTFNYDDGSSKIYDPDTAATFDGRLVTWGFGDNNFARQFYERHASRDGSEIIKRIYTTQASRSPEYGQTGVTVAPGALTWKEVKAYGAGSADWSAQAADFAETIRSEFDSQTHIRNATLGSPTVEYSEFGGIYAVPLDAQAGSLCGVIVKGSTKYYIWRKTADERGGFDYDRNQAVTSYAGNID